jgi:hypothetical protein
MKPFPPGSQQARLLVMLRLGPVSHLQAMVEGIGRCSDVVLKLRRRGYVISMQMDSMVNTRGLMVHFGRYRLLREPPNPQPMKSVQQFYAATGYTPENDDMDRVNCTEAGNPTHSFCGWCNDHDKPRFICGCMLVVKRMFPPPQMNESEVSPVVGRLTDGGFFLDELG